MPCVSELDVVFALNYSYCMRFLDALQDDLLTRRAANEMLKQQQKKAARRAAFISLVIPDVTDAGS